ncbi:cytochrome P450 [Astrocystis sublimbata]|nr:cytochrome P450 [Astrocystis sublimbata]
MTGTPSWLAAHAHLIFPLAITYYACLVTYRLFFHPLARFPGPKLAAISRWYEAYYDVIQNGQYTFKIAEMHKEYGPIIRISPHELHINDPSFFDTLYRQDGIWDKHAWSIDAFTASGSTIFAASHAVHKARRQPLSPFFSKARVASRQELLQRHVLKLLLQIEKFSNSSFRSREETKKQVWDIRKEMLKPYQPRKAINLGAAFHAFTHDVANEYILGKDYNSLGSGAQTFDAAAPHHKDNNPGHIWRITKHVRFFGPALRAIPPALVMRFGDEATRAFYKFIGVTLRDTQELMAAFEDGTTATTAATGEDEGEGEKGIKEGDKKPPNIVSAILSSKLPAPEKRLVRVFEDVSTVVGAGTSTTAGALNLIIFNVFSDRNPEILLRLRAELSTIDTNGDITSANANATETTEFPFPPLKTLEQLPFLTAVLTEGLRLSPATATRMGRVAPDRDLIYEGKEKWRIPAGTPVGMTTVLMHMDPALFPDPCTFDPDRWMDHRYEYYDDEEESERMREKEKDRRREMERFFAPFSRGTRNCVGMHLAWAELYLVVAVLVLRYEFEVQGKAEDFLPSSDNFAIGTDSEGFLKAFVSTIA